MRTIKKVDSYYYEKRFTRHCLKKRENPRRKKEKILEIDIRIFLKRANKKERAHGRMQKINPAICPRKLKKNNESKAIQVNAVTNFFKR